MRPITPKQIESLATVQQHFHDCYIVSSLGILSRSKKGQKILQNNITTNGKDFNIKFLNVNGKTEDYFISSKEIHDLKFRNSDGTLQEMHCPIVKSVELAMNKLIKNHPFKKPPIYRAITFGYVTNREGYTTIFVEDTGSGISEDAQKHIFERFYKEDSFTQGAGLGLSICQTIVDRLHGSISVSSELGKGTRFEVVIPDANE